MKNSTEYLIKLASLARQEGQKKIDSAAQAGAMDDFGGGQLVAQAEFFMMGMRREIPPAWRKFETQLQDPEYQKYLELRAKFEK